MEIEFKEGSRSRRLLLIVGIVLAFATGVGVFALTSGAQKADAQDVETVTIVVAGVDIAPRTVLDTGMLTTRTVPVDPSLDHAYTDMEALVGRATGTTIYAQQPITPNLLATSAVGSQFSVLRPDEVIGPDTPDWRAVSVDVTDERAVGGMIVAGQRVDLVVSAEAAPPQGVNDEGDVGPGTVELYGRVEVAPGATPPPGVTDDCRVTPYGEATNDQSVTRYCAVSTYFIPETTTKLAFQDVEVLAKEGTRYVLRVDARLGETISHLQADAATFSLLLRGDGDSRLVDTTYFGETTNRFIEEYEFTVPEAYPRVDDDAPYGTGPDGEPIDAPSGTEPEPGASPEPGATDELQ
jgi:hypothetical protein